MRHRGTKRQEATGTIDSNRNIGPDDEKTREAENVDSDGELSFDPHNNRTAGKAAATIHRRPLIGYG
jgi:hypothetical protein